MAFYERDSRRQRGWTTSSLSRYRDRRQSVRQQHGRRSMDSIFLTSQSGYQGQSGGYQRERGRRDQRYLHEPHRREEVSYQRSWDQERYSRRESRPIRPRSEPPRHRDGYNPYPVGRMRSPVPLARSPPSKGKEVVRYRSRNTRTIPHCDGIHQAVSHPQTQGKVPIFYSHPDIVNTSHSPKLDCKSEYKNNYLVPETNHKGVTIEWDRHSVQTEQPVLPSSHKLEDNSTSSRTRPVVISHKPRVAGIAPPRQRMRRPIVTTFPSVPTVKVMPKADLVHGKPSSKLSHLEVKPAANIFKQQKVSTSLSYSEPLAPKLALANKDKTSVASITEVNKHTLEKPVQPLISSFSASKTQSSTAPQSTTTPNTTTKPISQSSTSAKESGQDHAFLEQKTSADSTSMAVMPKKIIPFRPNFGNTASTDKNEDPYEDDSKFNCPTSPLIHMSESCVPLIQCALKSAAPTTNHSVVGRYSPDMIMSDEEVNPSPSKNGNNDVWSSSLPSKPFRPSFAPMPKESHKLSLAKDGQRKAVRRPKRKSIHSQEQVEYLFPPTSPVPALQVRKPRPAPAVKTFCQPVRLKQPPKGTRPLVLLDSIAQSPVKNISSKENGVDSAKNPISPTSSYVHLSERQLLKKPKVDKGVSVLVKNQPIVGLGKAIKSVKGKTYSGTILEPESLKNSSTGGLENALKELGETDNNQSEGAKEKNNKRQKRKLFDSSKQLTDEERPGKRLKVSVSSASKKIQEIKVNQGGLELFGSIQKPPSRTNDVSKTNGSSSTSSKSGKSPTSLNLIKTPERLPPEETITIPISQLESAPRSNNGVVFLIDGVTAGSCISVFRRKKTKAECFVTKKVKLKKKNLSESVSYHVHPSVGHQLTYFCARHVARWKMAPPSVRQDANGRSQHKVFVVTKDPRFSMLMKSLKADGVDVALVKELPNLRTVLESLVK